MDDDIRKLDELIAEFSERGARLGERGFEPVDPCEYVVVVELAQGGAVVHRPIMKRVNTLDSLEALARNIMEGTRGAIKSSVCRVVREQYLEEDYQ